MFAADPKELTFYSYSDIHYGADHGGKGPPKEKSEMMEEINTLPGKPYPEAVGGVVGTPRGVIMSGDLINDGAVAQKYPKQWADYIADFGVNGEGRCKWPVFEGVGNHDLNDNLYVFNKVKERNVIRKQLKLIDNVSSNGYHYSWDWEGVHFVNLNLFGGNVWNGEADAYGWAHHPQYARDFLIKDLQEHVGNSGRPVVYIQHFRPIDENWWTYSAADKLQKVLQDYNVIAMLVGHQGGGVKNVWRGLNWISSNGDLVVLRMTPSDNRLVAVTRELNKWGPVLDKKIFFSYESSGLPAVVNNGDWATDVTEKSAKLSGKIIYEAASPTKAKLYWGTTDGGTTASKWQNVKEVDVQKDGTLFSAEVTGLQPWTTYYYRCQASNAKGDAWALDSVNFVTKGVLPAGWQTTFVGYEQRPWGGAKGEGSSFTVKGSGRDIGEGGQRIDNFQYAYQEIEGDVEIKAKIATFEIKSREPKAGIMLRESLADNARHVSVLLGGMPGGIRLFSRKETGGASSISKANTIKAPYWVKLVRSGSIFSGYISEDGTTWTQTGTDLKLDMPTKIFAGLAVTAGNRDGSKLHTSDFEQVTITPKK
jgi:hypothetical protein